MSDQNLPEPSTKHYFVDEAGDGILFSRRGKRILVGTAGCSHYFILGLVDIPDPGTLGRELESLRADLLADPYFKDVPSIQPEQRKTAFCFHAKDDLPEIRREVFNLLRQKELRFFAVVRDKMKLLEYVRQRNERDWTYRYHPNELYDYLIRRLFKNLLHKNDRYHITFARRGKADRTLALQEALEVARRRFSQQWTITSQAAIKVIPAAPPESPGLQVADYFLWALQRLYERREERYVKYLWDSFRVVHDLDDTRTARYGVFYSQKKPLTLAALPEDNGPGI
jgi:hypothetical protein